MRKIGGQYILVGAMAPAMIIPGIIGWTWVYIAMLILFIALVFGLSIQRRPPAPITPPPPAKDRNTLLAEARAAIGDNPDDLAWLDAQTQLLKGPVVRLTALGFTDAVPPVPAMAGFEHHPDCTGEHSDLRTVSGDFLRRSCDISSGRRVDPPTYGLPVPDLTDPATQLDLRRNREVT